MIDSRVVVPYYLSQGYNNIVIFLYFVFVVVPYYLSQGYNHTLIISTGLQVVVPYYLSQGYNEKEGAVKANIVVVPYYLSQGYNAYPKRPQNHSLCGLFKCQKTNKMKTGTPVAFRFFFTI